MLSLATDALDPDRVYAAVGTYTNEWDPQNGAILRSSDRGETWDRTMLPFKVGGNMPGRGMGERLQIDALVASPDGKRMLRASRTGSPADAERLGIEAAQELLSAGADAILAELLQDQPAG